MRPIKPSSDPGTAGKGRIILWGLMGSMPFGGMVWQVYHYLIGLRQLGFDVWYVEDSDRMVYDPVHYCPTIDTTANVALLREFMARIGFADRWVFRLPASDNQFAGAADKNKLLQLYRDADAAIDLCGAQEWRPEHESIRMRIFLETDPVANQVSVANGNRAVIERLDRYHHHFTYGENIGQPECRVPLGRYAWKPTRPPVSVEHWQDASPPPGDAPLTSIANWKHSGNDVVWQGETWHWSKHHEFLRFIDLPSRSALPMELAVGAIGDDDLAGLHNAGWRIRPSSSLNEPDAYRRYIQAALGEFTVAKEQYWKPASGWFSDRSVCFLAAGRPVITQDTGFGRLIPTGEGLFSFRTEGDALLAIDAIASDYGRHACAAREIAVEYFSAPKVIADMMRQAGLL